MFKFTLLMLLFTHISGCFWYYLTKFNTENYWLMNFENENKSEINLYILSLYWAISTICTVGFGDIHPINLLEKILNIIWISVGVAVYSYMIGSLSNILKNLYENKNKVLKRFAFLNYLAS